MIAAESLTPDDVTFALKHTSGILCATISKDLAEKLKLHPMTDQNTDPNRTAFTVSIDHTNCSTVRLV